MFSPQALVIDQHPLLILAIFNNKWDANDIYCSGFSLLIA